MVDDTVLSYFVKDDMLWVGAWDTQNGHERWRALAHPGWFAGGITRSVDLVETQGTSVVAHFAPSSNERILEFHLRDPRTGEALDFGIQGIRSMALPKECDQPDGGVCIFGSTLELNGNSHDIVRFDLETRETSIVDPPENQAPATSFTESLSWEGGETVADDVLVFRDGKTELWRRSFSDVFGSGYSPRAGWEWSERDGMVIGTGAYWGDNPDEAHSSVRSLEEAATVALDAETGNTLWKVEAATTCQSSAPLRTKNDLLTLCRIFSGEAHLMETDDDEYRIENLDAELIAVDRVTGEVEWSRPLLADESSIVAEDKSFAPPTTHGALRQVGGEIDLVDFESGDAVRLPNSTVLACEFSRQIASPETFSAFDYFSAGDAARACSPDGREVSRWSEGAVQLAGTRANGDVWVVSESDGLVGFVIDHPATEPAAAE
ncbi:PQQ-binding-like beta-propeller repeat protein [Microcella putealis]|uniref:PQQ-binding-like beta-propeller repeat protein n=1 Tax=Microcella putealis TaxID=337005 RepID=UPI0013002B59|nr:PQQ-binding-like beta-propeller repeat protein [Microcella putealis]